MRQGSRTGSSLRSRIALAELGSGLSGLPVPTVWATVKGLLAGVKSFNMP